VAATMMYFEHVLERTLYIQRTGTRERSQPMNITRERSRANQEGYVSTV
jgi:hypothetical protein